MLAITERELSDDVKAELARSAPMIDPRMAEVVPGVEAKWFLVEIYRARAEAKITELGFGLCVPEVREVIVRRGRKINCRRSMFPGYVLVFMWNGNRNYRRLMACEGVSSIVGALHDEEVDLIRAVENAQGFPLRIKPRHHGRIRSRRFEDWLKEIRSLDSDKRNQALRKLLSLF